MTVVAVEVVGAGQDSACLELYLRALESRHNRNGKEIFLPIDNGSCHTNKQSRAALHERKAWLHVLWLARYSPQLNKKEREWRYLKRDVRSHPPGNLREFVDEIKGGLERLGERR